MQSPVKIAERAMLRIEVNGEATQTAATTLDELLGLLDLAEARVATALNEIFVPRQLRQDTQLADGDRVEILAPREGG